MLTPVFNIDQDNDKLIINIKAPYTKISEVDILCDGSCFCFQAKPYYLRLELPEEITEDNSNCKYDVDSGIYTVNVKKVEKDKHFSGLEFLTTLLAGPKTTNTKPCLVEEIEDKVPGSVQAEINFNWNEIVQFTDDEVISFGYGFCNQKQDVITKLQNEGLDIVYIKNPETTSFPKRNILRKKSEDEKFDSDHYLADLFENEVILEKIHFQPWWKEHQNIEFTSDENDKLLHLPRRSYLLSQKENKLAYLGVVDILFAYAYDIRSTEDEENVESAWTIRTISSCLSWCDYPSSLKNAIVACCRRSLCYPLFRNWELALQVINDVAEICKSGVKCILRCFLAIHQVFQSCNSDPTYVLNDLFISDYCVWLQTQPEKHFASLSEAIKHTKLYITDCRLDLDVLEQAAKLTLSEEGFDSVNSSDEELDSDDDSNSVAGSNSDYSSDDNSESEVVESSQTDKNVCLTLNKEIKSLSLDDS